MAEDPLLADDPLDDLGDTSDGASGGGKTRLLREAYKREKSRAAELETKLQQAEREAEDRGYAKATREFSVQQAFEKVGYPGLAKAWVQMNPEGEATTESVGTFLTDMGITPKTEGEPPPEQAVKEAAAFHTPVQSSGPTTGEKMGRAELRRVYETNPSEAIRLFNEGRVDLSAK